MTTKMVKWFSAFVVSVMLVVVVPQAASAESSVSGTFPDRTFSVVRSPPGGPRANALVVDILPACMGEWWASAETISGSAVIVEVWRNDAGAIILESSSKLREAGQESARSVLMGGLVYSATITPSGKGGTSVLHEHFSSLFQGSVMWLRQFGTSALDLASGIAIYDSSLFLAGYTNAGLLNDALPGQKSFGSIDAFVRKCDLNGNEIWTRQFGTKGVDRAHDIAVDASGIYVVGETGGAFPGQTLLGDVDAFVRKYDLSGNEVWTKQIGYYRDVYCAYAVAVDTSGVYVGGYGLHLGQTSFVHKYTLDGALIWSDWSIPGNCVDAIAVDPMSAFFVGYGLAGSHIRKCDLNGNEIWSCAFSPGSNGFDVAVSPTAVYLAGSVVGELPGQQSYGYSDAFVRKYDLNGNEEWTRQFGTAAGDEADAIAVDSSGVYVAGIVEGNAYVRKYDINGNEVWTCLLGNLEFSIVLGAVVDSSGVYVAGETAGVYPGQIGFGSMDVFLAKLSL